MARPLFAFFFLVAEKESGLWTSSQKLFILGSPRIWRVLNDVYVQNALYCGPCVLKDITKEAKFARKE